MSINASDPTNISFGMDNVEQTMSKSWVSYYQLMKKNLHRNSFTNMQNLLLCFKSSQLFFFLSTRTVWTDKFVNAFEWVNSNGHQLEVNNIQSGQAAFWTEIEP